MDKTYIQHHGVEGMKWGIRRFQRKDGTLTTAGKKRRAKSENYHDDYKKAHSKKSVREMSNTELRERNNRLQMERQYADLTAKKNRGKQFITTFVATAGTITAVTAAYKTYAKIGNDAVDKIGDKILANINLKGPLH